MSESTVKLFLILLIALNLYGCGSHQEQKLLIFSKTAGYHHNSIDAGLAAISKLATENNIKMDTTTDAALFTEDNLAQYSVVIFLSTTGDVLNHYQQADFERYIQAGGGFVGIHAAADTEYDWPWYNQLVGAYFQSHPHQQDASIQVLNRAHPATKHLPEVWNHFDEWYNYRSIADGLNVLMNLDESSYEGGENGESHPIAWNREFDGGRMFYTGLGHTEEAYTNPLFLQHIWGGINYAMNGSRQDYARATSARVPEANRFVREVLAFNLNEPMELDYLPGEKILFIERGGDLKLYDLKAGELRNAGHLNVKRVAEDGLLGLAVDPDFAANQWIYLFYSSTGKEKLQRLSRFSFVNDQVDLASENVLLEFPATHDCCHSGGSLEFDAAGNLYLSTGDNTNPFESDGFSPSDERPGRSVYDAQKSSANTNDLRGKILRIKPEADGTYSIPSGNLFEDNDPKTRPEIYAMGLRNPFRISVDQKTGILYWGDVGPDSGYDDPKRGPKGHDEINQAIGPGNWGWPYTRGNNKVYWDYDFAKKESVRPFDPVNLINNSPHNTGIQNLPPAQESFVWYGYDASGEFPWLGEGGRTAMAGPVFNKDLYAKTSNGFPDYFDGKLMIYEWMRDWIFLITMDENHDFVKAEPFLDHEEFHNPMDMVFGEDGNLYILEYGESWNTQNMDAQLNRISFVAGNRPPIASITAGASVGTAPLTVSFSAENSEDLEGDPLKYQWTASQGVGNSTEANPDFTFEKAGSYEVTLTVRDTKGLSAQATHTVVVGNAPPEIEVSFETENTFYNSRGKLGYQVSVVDAEDGSTASGDIAAGSVTVALDFIPDARLQNQAVGHQIEIVSNGKKYMDNSDCMACHTVDKRINGPSYIEIAQKYSEDHVEYLKNKIKNGGAGVWGETPMAAHPQLADEEIEEIVKYILSLEKAPGSLPIKGSLDFNQHKPDNMGGLYVLSASYTDKGNGEASALSSTMQYTFSASVLQAEQAEESHEANTVWQALGADVVGNIKDGHWFAFDDVLFDDLGSISFRGLYNAGYQYAGSVEVWKGGPEQELLGSAKLSYFDAEEQSFQSQLIRLKKSSGRDKLYIRFQNKSDVNQFIANADYLTLNYNKRGQVMKKGLLTLAGLLLLNFTSLSQAVHEDERYVPETDPLVLEKLKQWQGLKFGLLMHWGAYSQWGIVESWSLCPEEYGWCERTKGSNPNDYFTYKREYENLALTFNPVHFNPEKWAAAAKAAGMKYVVFTTKHHDGFSMFDSQYTDYKVNGSKSIFKNHPRANITKEIFNAFRAEGMWTGAYFSKPDWHSEYYWDPKYPPRDRNVNYEPEANPEKWQQFTDFTHNQILELLTDYGKVDILWLDGGWVAKTPKAQITEWYRDQLAAENRNGYLKHRIVNQDIKMDELVVKARKKQPGLIVVDRAVYGKNQNYLTPENRVPEKALPYPWESCIISGGGWSHTFGAKYMSGHQGVHMLVDIVAKGGNLLLNIAPGPDGTWQQGAYDLLQEYARWMEVNAEGIYETHALAPYKEGKVAITQKPDGTTYFFYMAEEEEKVMPAEIRVKSLQPAKGAKVSLLGKGNLKWKAEGAGFVVTIPEKWRKNPPADYVWGIKVSELTKQ